MENEDAYEQYHYERGCLQTAAILLASRKMGTRTLKGSFYTVAISHLFGRQHPQIALGIVHYLIKFLLALVDIYIFVLKLARSTHFKKSHSTPLFFIEPVERGQRDILSVDYFQHKVLGLATIIEDIFLACGAHIIEPSEIIEVPCVG